MSFWGALSRILRPRPAPARGPETYAALRGQVLAVTPETLGVKNPPAGKILGLLMETGYEKAVVTLVVLSDDTVSLYFGNGGGMIGLGAHDGPRDAGRRLLEKAAAFHGSFTPIQSPPTPALGQSQFVAITPGGLLHAGAREEELGNNRHALSPLFHAAHEVITQIRLNSQKNPR